MPKSRSGLKRPTMNIENISAAIEDIERGMTIEMAAKKHMVAKTTLWRHYKKHQMSSTNKPNQRLCRVYETSHTSIAAAVADSKATKQVFSDAEEVFLAEYIKTLAQLKYDLSREDVMKFAYLIASKNHKAIPLTWSRNESADRTWLRTFLKKHPHIPVGNAKDESENDDGDDDNDDDDVDENDNEEEEDLNSSATNTTHEAVTLQNAKECLSLLLFNQILNFLKTNNYSATTR